MLSCAPSRFPRAVLCSLGVSWHSLTLSCPPLSHLAVPNTVPCPRVPQHSPISPQCPPMLSHLPLLDSGVPQHCSVSLRGVFRSPHSVVFPLSCPGDPHTALCVCPIMSQGPPMPSCVPSSHPGVPCHVQGFPTTFCHSYHVLGSPLYPQTRSCHPSCVLVSPNLILSPLLCPWAQYCHHCCVLVSPNVVVSPLSCPQTPSCHPFCVLVSPNLILSTFLCPWSRFCHPSCVLVSPGPILSPLLCPGVPKSSRVTPIVSPTPILSPLPCPPCSQPRGGDTAVPSPLTPCVPPHHRSTPPVPPLSTSSSTPSRASR